jgi:hypothetical protein
MHAFLQAALRPAVNPFFRRSSVVATQPTLCAAFSLGLYSDALAELDSLPTKGFFLRFLLQVSSRRDPLRGGCEG